MPLVSMVIGLPLAGSTEGNNWKPLEKLPAPPCNIASPERPLGLVSELRDSKRSKIRGEERRIQSVTKRWT